MFSEKIVIRRCKYDIYLSLQDTNTLDRPAGIRAKPANLTRPVNFNWLKVTLAWVKKVTRANFFKKFVFLNFTKFKYAIKHFT